jgi:hypothetical protein
MDNSPLKMVSWYDPRLLARIGIRTIVSSVFGQYADQRLVQAATDPIDQAGAVTRYDYRDPTHDDPMRTIALDQTGAFWIDYLADTGDGFEPTYTMAYLLAQESLRVGGAGTLPQGDLLILGGDQCYPQATREAYKEKLLTPFQWAFDLPTPKRKLFAIPGNHDWYDGLNAFDSLFCASRDKLSDGKGNAIGGWQCQQHRSYWSIRLPYNWWIWGTDIQFSKYLDAAQVNYFETIAAEMGPDDKIIICMAEPSWMLADMQGQDAEENFSKITTIARKSGARVCLALAGDWHHYNRYYAHEHDVHFMTAGGGGSFMHPTHMLKQSISVNWPERQERTETSAEPAGATRAPAGDPRQGWRSREVNLSLARKGAKNQPVQDVVREVESAVEHAVDTAVEPIEDALGVKRRRKSKTLKPQAPKCYPEKGVSAALSLRNLAFPFYNPAFAIGIGIIYWLITWQFFTLTERFDISAGKIDAIGVHNSFGEVMRFMPLYLIQASLVSILFAGMLLGLYALLVSYVDATEQPGLRRTATKLGVGTAHFLAHLTAMFAAGLLFVMANNVLSPRVEQLANLIWQGPGADKTVVGGVLKEALEPLSGERRTQREMFGRGAEKSGTMTKGVPPSTAMPDAKALSPVARDALQATPLRQILGFVLYPLEMIIAGGFLGGFIWGLYWVITGLARMHAEDAFAALRIKDYKNFVRFKFERDQLTIYPIGVDRVPRRMFWTAHDPKSGNTSRSRLDAPTDIDLRLIERPIVIKASGGS